MLPQFNFQNQVNAVGGVAVLIVGGYLAWDLTRSREIPVCSLRFPVATQMSFQKPDGAAMTPAEFQARVGMGERGVIEKTAVRRGDSVQPLVLDVRLGGPDAADTGAGFSWSLPGLAKAKAACLGYSIFVPADFDYAGGGTLPGLFGEASGAATTNGQSGFASRVAWNDQGTIGLQMNLSGVTNDGKTGEPVGYLSATPLPKGRWVRIEQETVLNSPNAKDGLMRLWVDGRLSVEDLSVAWRGNGGVHLNGALVDIGYGPMTPPTEKKPTAVTLSPLQLAWQ